MKDMQDRYVIDGKDMAKEMDSALRTLNCQNECYLHVIGKRANTS